MTAPKHTPWWRGITRSLILFSTGLALTIKESFDGGAEHPSRYVLWAGMMGLDPVLRFAESVTRKKGE